MSRSTRKPPVDANRKARYREIARKIVKDDRFRRKYGLVVDTGGAIARALERAFKEGYCAAKDGKSAHTSVAVSNTGSVEWTLIPPRPRSAFWSICLGLSGWENGGGRDTHLERCLTERRTDGWRLVPGGSNERAVAQRSVAPLMRLGLLVENAAGNIVLSDRGRATWREFLDHGGEFPDDLS